MSLWLVSILVKYIIFLPLQDTPQQRRSSWCAQWCELPIPARCLFWRCKECTGSLVALLCWDSPVHRNSICCTHRSVALALLVPAQSQCRQSHGLLPLGSNHSQVCSNSLYIHTRQPDLSSQRRHQPYREEIYMTTKCCICVKAYHTMQINKEARKLIYKFTCIVYNLFNFF